MRSYRIDSATGFGVSVLPDRLGNLKEDLICVRLEQTKHPEGEHKNNAERCRVFDDGLSLVLPEGFG